MSVVHLHLDFETRSPLDIREVGLENYARAAEPLMMAYAVNDQAPELWLPPAPFPEHINMLLNREECVKLAWNANFERAILKHCLKIDSPPEQWLDPSILARYAGLPAHLDGVCKFLSLGDAAKADGKRLIHKFCRPRPRRKSVTGVSYHNPVDFPQDWQKFQDYCRQDVVAERAVLDKLKHFFYPPLRERKLAVLDAKINSRGIPVDLTFVYGAQAIVASERERLLAEARALTGLDNPNSNAQLLPWLKAQGYPFSSLAQKRTAAALADASLPAPVRAALELRAQLSKSSNAKLDAIASRVSLDGRLRQNYKFYGASRTGRWSGEGVQLQNFPRGNVKQYDAAVAAIREGDVATVRQFGNPLEVVSGCLRAAFRAPQGQSFVVADLSAIENRVLAWLTRCGSMMAVYDTGLDPYKDFGTRLFRKAYDQITPLERQLAKPAVLGCGYMLSGGELLTDKHGDEYKSGLWGYAANMGIDMTREQAHEAVRVFRASYPEVVEFWRDVETAAQATVATGEERVINGIRFGLVPGKLLWALLPSGRRLHYINPRLGAGKYSRPELSYECQVIGEIWGRRKLYGGLLTENLVQAIARDVLAEGMLRADAAGAEIVGHTHDEIITLAAQTNADKKLEELIRHMTKPMPWAADIPLAASGWHGEVYRK